MKLLPLSLAGALLVPIAAQAQESVFLLDPPASLSTAPAKAKNGATLAEFELRMPLAVRLEADVDPASAQAAAVNAKYPLKTGAVLIGLAEYPGVYCTSISNRGLGLAGPCLIDADSDGRFEAIVKAGFQSPGAERMMISSSRRVIGVKMGKAQPLSAPIAYQQTSYAGGHAAIGRLVAMWSYKPGQFGPVAINFHWDASGRGTGTSATSPGIVIKYQGMSVKGVLDGVTIEVLGFDPVTREISYRIHSATPEAKVRLNFYNRLPVQIIFI